MVCWHSGNYRVWIHSRMRTWHDKIIQSNAPYRQKFRTQLNNLVSLAKSLSFSLRAKWFWVRVQLQELKFQILLLLGASSSLTLRQLQNVDSLWNNFVTWQEHTVKCQMHTTDKYSEQSSIIWPVSPNRWVFLYQLGDSGLESCCSHLNFRFRYCFQEGVARHSGNYAVGIHSEMCTWHDENIKSNALYIDVSRTGVNDLVRLAICLSVRWQDKWFWVQDQIQSLKFHISCVLPERSSLTFRQL